MFLKCFQSTLKRKVGVFQFLRLESVYENHRFLGGLMWRPGLTQSFILCQTHQFFFIISFSLCTVPWLMKNQGLAVLAWHKKNILRCLASVTNTAVLSVDCVKTHCGPIFSHCRPIIVVAQNETVPVIRASNTFSVKNAKKCLKKREKAVQIRK